MERSLSTVQRGLRPTAAAAMVLALLAAPAGVAPAFAQEAEEPIVYAGCIDTEGFLVNVAEGDEPSAPCAEDATLARWNALGPEGPQGPEGPEGPAGPEGPQGPAGVAETYVVSAAGSQAFDISLVARCDEGDRVTGGGFQQSGGPATWVVASYPSGGRAWTVTLAALAGSLEAIEVEAFAVCSDREPVRS